MIRNMWGPNASLTMSFCFKGQISYLAETGKTALQFASISGLQKKIRHINYDTGTSAIIVLFKEAGLTSFFKLPLHELFGQSISLNNFFSTSEIATIQQQLLESKCNAERVFALDRFLLSKFNPQGADRIIEEAVSKIKIADGDFRIKKLAKELYISQDAFEKRFRKIIGTTPKQFSHIVKMNSIIANCKPNCNLFDVAFENGYFDQPHFNRDFKNFTGQTPSHFFHSSVYW